MEPEYIEVVGAREHNLKNITVKIPKDQLVVITGISGSGKSSLAFDTIYAEGQRRYMETFGAYARQFIGKLERPDIEHISGLSPVISIEQKTTGWNPRSTVGTTTEVYDFLRLLFARIGEAYSYVSGLPMIRFSEEEIIQNIQSTYANQKIMVLAPVVRGRKGHYRELFESILKQGYTKVRVNGRIEDVKKGMKVERFKTHNIEIVIDRLKIDGKKRDRLAASIAKALKAGNGLLFVLQVDNNAVKTYSQHLMDAENNISYEEPSPNTFSFNSPYGACPKCNGLGYVSEVDEKKVIPDSTKSINEGGIAPFGEVRDNFTFKQLRAISKRFGFTFSQSIEDIPDQALQIILNGGDESFDVSLPYSKHDFTYNLAYEGLYKMLDRWYNDTSSDKIRSWAEGFMTVNTCSECNGMKLKKESLHFKLADHNISELGYMNLDQLFTFIDKLPSHLTKKQLIIGNEVIKEIRVRLQFLLDVGLGYLHLHRQAKTLSGGESQRTRLANQIGSQLSGITYILDEPSIGLHSRDNQRLISSLKTLVESGNTVIVVEHDKDIMLASDHLIDLGPGAGKLGGEVVGEGSPERFVENLNSRTARFLNHSDQIPIPKKRREGHQKDIILHGATGHNLNNLTVSFPLGKLICVTGVSGSGKSSLVIDTLYPILRKHLYRSNAKSLPYEKVEGLDHIDKVIEIDQSPIGRTTRSNPATYTGVFTEIRKLFSEVPEAKIRGYKPGRFSFNVKGGRCETCKGGGQRIIEMNFLPDVLVDCEECQGKRYNSETLEVLYKGKSINDVLNMTVLEATGFFESIPKIYRKLKTLLDVGLGYISLGQSATTISGGEAQRVKLAEELSKRATGKTFYILDEPTTGLHFSDIKQLLTVLGKLVDKGNTVLIIEHNMDVIKVADHIIDIGPEGGEGGGQIVAQGSPEQLIKFGKGHTAQFLQKEIT